MTAQETFRPTFPHATDNPYPRLTYGLPFYEACAKHLKETFHSQRPYIIASNTLSKKTNFLSQLQQALGDGLAGTWIGIKAHTPLDDLLPILEDMRTKNADSLITLGGGSLSDGGKAIIYALANNVFTEDDFVKLGNRKDLASSGPDMNAPSIPLICIPISLSGGEYSKYAGVTDPKSHLKIMYGHERMFPSLVILDPELTISSPERLWLSSGVRSIDHCVEGYLSTNAKPSSSTALLEALSLLVKGLLETKKNPEDLEARLNCQLGSNLSMTALYEGVWKGASHGIGHQLGPQGVGHGETSCILLPAVCKYNKRVNTGQQEELKKVLATEEVVRRVSSEAGLDMEKADLGDVLRAIFNALGMPKSLKEVGIGREKLDEVAENSLQDHFCRTNPIPIDSKEKALEILEMVVT
ncbi:Dehydroquinate synthase-like protein [Mollisia scopiformis]|uniref:Dehydroquinate synthase-like protein n=1 Tax=Mollisia scopiformis TaxID=149040 RepID=A0A194X0I0_MOLSC|nr:Dehydroquinate synthase-like protein [Mollisia scopiformis]KUJ13464.1 Dehydroquinate synthase-like protein [Mollisia scopiformis]